MQTVSYGEMVMSSHRLTQQIPTGSIRPISIGFVSFAYFRQYPLKLCYSKIYSTVNSVKAW